MTLSLLRNGTPAKEPVKAKIGTRLKTYSRTLSLKPPPLRSGTMAMRAWSRNGPISGTVPVNSVEQKVLGRDGADEVDRVDEFALQPGDFQRVEPHRLALQEQRLAFGDLGSNAFLVIVRDVDQPRAIAAAGEMVEHAGQRPAHRNPVEDDAIPFAVFQELVERATHPGSPAAIGGMRQDRGEAAPMRIRRVARQPPHDMIV